MADRETIIDPGDGGAGLVAGLLLLALIAVVGVFFLTLGHDEATMINLDAPNLTMTLVTNGP